MQWHQRFYKICFTISDAVCIIKHNTYEWSLRKVFFSEFKWEWTKLKLYKTCWNTNLFQILHISCSIRTYFLTDCVQRWVLPSNYDIIFRIFFLKPGFQRLEIFSESIGAHLSFKGWVISEGVFNLNPSSKKSTKSLSFNFLP